MKFDNYVEFSDDEFENSERIRDVLEKYLKHIKWFVLCVLMFPLISFFLLKFVTPKYGISSTILIKDNEKGSSFTDLTSFESLGLFGDGENSLENEIQILKSRKLMTNVVKELRLNVRYFNDNYPIAQEQYSQSPITILFDVDSNGFSSVNTEFRIAIKSKSKIDFIDYNSKIRSDVSIGSAFLADLGNDLGINQKQISINFTENFDEELIGETFIVKINPVDFTVDMLMERIVIEPISANLSKVIKLSLKDAVEEKGISIINNLIDQYNADGINDKKLVAQATIDFLDLRVGLISAELVAIEGTAEQFKSKNRMLDTQQGSNYYLESSTLNERNLVEANTQIQLITYMLEELAKTSRNQLLPGNIGLSDGGIINLIGEYNELILQRNRVLKSSSVKNPIIVGIDSQLDVLKNNLRSSMLSLKSSTEIQINSLNVEGGKISSRIATVPKNEREFKDIVREQETKNALYLFLLQKREESILSNAINVDKAKIIDRAYGSGLPISPKKGLFYFASVLLGLLFPFLIIYMKDILDTKVHDEKDLRKLSIPYLGDIPMSNSKKYNFIEQDDNSKIAEAFRYVRTSINFMLEKNQAAKTIFVTSTQAGEGKSVTAINLANSFAISGKKTLLLAMDLRAPKISKYLNFDNSIGVSNYVLNKDLNIDSLVSKYTNHENLDILNSGDIPPNPVELLMSNRIAEIFEYARNYYDYIIVDTAPVGLVTDTIQISSHADLTIYVVKANELDKRMLHIPQKLFKENKLKNMCFLINGSNNENGNYGYGYGYGKLTKKNNAWYKNLF